VIQEVLGSLIRVPRPIQAFYAEVMRRKKDDHHASHSNGVNQVLHIVSSSAFIACYALVWSHLTVAMWTGLVALFLRQIGHAVLEPPCHDKEAALLGYNTRNKTLILGVYLLIPVVYLAQAGDWSLAGLMAIVAPVAKAWLAWTAAVVGGRVAYLALARGGYAALVWFVKVASDPLTDLVAYIPRHLGAARMLVAGGGPSGSSH
jgi:glutamate-1-semialdehyde 2,1-aminomutase